MTNRVHAILQPRPFVLELVALSSVYFRRIPVVVVDGRKLEAWYLAVLQPGDSVASIVCICDPRDTDNEPFPPN